MYPLSSELIGQSKSFSFLLSISRADDFGIFRVFIDDVDTLGKIGGNGYEYYGIDKKEGAIVIVRPDGYVGTIAPFNGTEHLKNYFANFMSQA